MGQPVARVALGAALLAILTAVALALQAAPRPAGAPAPPTRLPQTFAPFAATAAAMPACAPTGTPVPRPDDFPAGFPFPPGTVLTSRQARLGGRQLDGVVPGDVRLVGMFLDNALAQGGFRQALREGEANEAEASYAGEGYQGRWKLHTLANCPGALSFSVFAAR